MNLRIIIAVILGWYSMAAFAQSDSLLVSSNPTDKINEVEFKHSIGASLFMILNFFPDPADYYLLTYGYRLKRKERIFVEFNTWKYSEPLGTYGNSNEHYPGFVRAFGLGVGYQRFLWRGLYIVGQGTPFLKHYYDSDREKIQNGFQLYLQLVAGYRFELFNNRLYVEPAYALKYWPVDTNFPEAFQKLSMVRPRIFSNQV